ncbi:MAG: MoaD/ThiS family protein [Acidimicrobiia bacterium]
MARLRLFANLREAAGTATAEVPGASVAEVLVNASVTYGPDFEQGLDSARVWVNGDPAGPETSVSDGDEVAVLPPVSGGEAVVRSPIGFEAGLVGALLLILFLANYTSLQWFVVAVVFVAGFWAFDLLDFAARKGNRVAAGPVFLAVVASALGSYRWGFEGFAFAAALAVMAALAWGALERAARPVEVVAANAVAALVASLGVGPLVLVRMRAIVEISGFLLVVAAASAAAWLGGRLGSSLLDPLTSGGVAALGAGVIAGLTWGPTLWTMLVASGAIALTLVAGRNLGSLLRAGSLSVAGPVPGSLSLLDGPLLAAGPYWLVLTAMT